jgi:hypothetical protein
MPSFPPLTISRALIAGQSHTKASLVQKFNETLQPNWRIPLGFPDGVDVLMRFNTTQSYLCRQVAIGRMYPKDLNPYVVDLPN